jgi:hypothetical protein
MLKLRRSRLGGSIGVARVVIWASLAQRVVELIVGHIVYVLTSTNSFRLCWTPVTISAGACRLVKRSRTSYHRLDIIWKYIPAKARKFAVKLSSEVLTPF